tara:strand:- start:1986 stop:3107 length:1122 start_codon:yes stop_codon:yes gene_type:complete
MATDVSGTIHIIAEVMGNAGSPIAGTGAVAKGSEKRKQEKLKITVFGVAFDVKQVIKYLTIGGLIANSKTLTNIFTSLSYFLGVIADVFFRPILPLLIWTLGHMFKFLTYLSKFTRGEKSFSEVWGDWTNFWINQWNEVGFLGIIKNMFKLGTGLGIFATLIGGLVAGPAGASFVLNSILRWSGGKFALDVIANVLGIKKVPKLSEARKGTRAARTARFVKQKTLSGVSMLGRVLPVGKILIAAGALLTIFALDTLGPKPWDNITEKIKEVFFSGEPVGWKDVLGLLGLFGAGVGLSLLHLIELVTFGSVTAEEARAWYIAKFLEPVSDAIDDFTDAGELAVDFVDNILEGSITIGQDFMNIITSPLEILSRE